MVNTASNTGCALNGYVRSWREGPGALDQCLYWPVIITFLMRILHQQLIRVKATAVVATSDNIALGLLRYLYERGLHVPRLFCCRIR